jgi:hypothetical protein
MNTRGMQGLTISRASSESITLRYTNSTEQIDGTATVVNTDIPCKASVGILQERDIERLEKAGIIVQNGVTIAIPTAREQQPDTIIHGTKKYRVINWAATQENGNVSVVATCDEITIPGAE